MNDEQEFRRDPVCGRWVIIAPERARRPITLLDAGPRSRTAAEETPCQFCAGQEQHTPNELLAFREPGSEPNGPGWRLRVVPNKYPGLRLDAPFRDRPSGLDHAFPAFGAAEVLIESPEHIDNPAHLSDEQLRDVFLAYRLRMTALAADERLAYVAAFKNVGAEAGASLGHTHSQIIATPIVPDLIQHELNGAEAYFARSRSCVFCKLLSEELAVGSRLVARSANFAAVMAYAPRFAYEMWLLPLAHQSCCESLSDSAAQELAQLLRRVLRALDTVQHEPAYNWFVHTSPLRVGELAYYHWHVEILPRTSRPAGLEWGHGCHITTAVPEQAAEELRAALPAGS